MGSLESGIPAKSGVRGARQQPVLAEKQMKFQGDTQTSINAFNFTSSSLNTTMQRFGFQKPKLALAFADLLADPEQLLMVTVSKALQEIGYEIEVYSLEDGPVHGIWQQMGVPVTILETNNASSCVIDWLSFMQEPFKSLPLVWVINEETLVVRSRQYNSTGHTELLMVEVEAEAAVLVEEEKLDLCKLAIWFQMWVRNVVPLHDAN